MDRHCPETTLQHRTGSSRKFFGLFKILCMYSLATPTCRILISQAGIEPTPSALKVQSLNHWTTREVPGRIHFLRTSVIILFAVFYSFCVVYVIFHVATLSEVNFTWSRKWQPTPIFLPGESHGQRSLVGYSPWGSKELDQT